MKDKLPKEYMIPDPYNIPIHDQKDKNNCTSHAFSYIWELELSNMLKEQVTIDVDDLWEKQKKYGTATEEGGDTLEDVIKIANEYGVVFKTESGKKGTYKPSEGIKYF